ncbi:hypothetical protein YC2023_051465 [Brassica napus]
MKIGKNGIFPRGDKLESKAEKEGRPTLEAYIRGLCHLQIRRSSVLANSDHPRSWKWLTFFLMNRRSIQSCQRLVWAKWRSPIKYWLREKMDFDQASKGHVLAHIRSIFFTFQSPGRGYIKRQSKFQSKT